MTADQETSKKIAELLLQIKAIRLQPDKPFTWASGWKSPIYCDNRISLSHPKVRTYIRQALVTAIEKNYGTPDVIAGVATAAIAQGALVAEAMGLPFIYIRSSPKDHGRENLIEGELIPGQKVVVIEDLVSTGNSSLKAVQAIRDAGSSVKGMICIFNYGFPLAEENFINAECPLISLCEYNTLIDQALETDYIKSSDIELLKRWREEPAVWSA
jgi:orotate phosphoribosyltransferase